MTIDMIHRAVTKGQGLGIMSMTPVYFHIELPNHSIHRCLTAYTRDSPAPTLVSIGLAVSNIRHDRDCLSRTTICLVCLFDVSQS